MLEELVREFIETKTKDKRDGNDVISSQLNPHAKEFMYPAVKPDSELSPSDFVGRDFAIVADVLDKLGSTIRPLNQTSPPLMATLWSIGVLSGHLRILLSETQ